MKKLRYILLLCLLGTINVCSQTVLYDTANIEPKVLPVPPSQVYTGREFNYDTTPATPTFIERIWQAITDFLNKLFDWNLRADSASTRKALWISLSVLLGVLIVAAGLFFCKKFRNTLGRNDKNSISAYEAERNINEVDFDKLIENAYKSKNYRLAVRLYYLKMLKTLKNRQIIEYQYQKTNHEYYYEIKDETLRALFKEVSFVFDYCWYGEYEADESDFLFAKQKFEKIAIYV